ncbi:MAG: DUF11 domain-containing protein [Renibacterium salmoninarum]|nr:DUF11 domain-containing protein [Renibacterium salmoninarum]
MDWTDSATLNGVALGNNNAAGNSAPPPGVSLGNQAECNSTIDVQNETICYLGNYVTDQPIAGSGYQKRPGMGYFASNTTFNGAGQPTGKPSNSVGYDADVIRIPDAAIPSGTTEAKLSMKGNGEWLDFGMAGISIDLPSMDPTVTKTVQKVDGTGPVLPGDELEYTISAQNEGKDVGVAGFLTDTLPAGVSYVSNSMRVSQGVRPGRQNR